MTANKPIVAVDIETVSPGKQNINPQNPDDVELLCIGVGYRKNRDSSVETHVLFRRGTKPRHELELLDRLYEWFLTHRAERLLTYNGRKFDLLHLKGRAERAERSLGTETNVPRKIETILEIHEHVDLFDDARDRYDSWPKLEKVCEDHDIPIPDTTYKGRVITNDMLPTLGEEYLSAVERGDRSPELHRALIEYTVSDIEPLFRIYDIASEN